MIISFPPCNQNLSVGNQADFIEISNLLLCNEINLTVMSLLFSKRPHAHLQIPKPMTYGICVSFAHGNNAYKELSGVWSEGHMDITSRTL